MEKEHQPDSMTTVTMKPDYPPSEVYSTSEPPPAYRQRPSNSVQIAKIAALTIVASAFILGSFILASSWVSARSRCQQLEDLEALLYDKEMGMDGRSYGNDALVADEPLPVNNAHALHALPPSMQPSSSPPAEVVTATLPSASQVNNKEDALKQEESKVNEDKLQKIDDEDTREPKDDSQSSDEDSDSLEDEDELDVMRPNMMKVPIQFGLDELADFLSGAQSRGRMNCMVERRQDDPMSRAFPFNILSALMPRSARAERVAIICHGGQEEPRPVPGYGEPAAQVFAFPLSGPARMPLRPSPVAEPNPMMQAPMPQPMQRSPFALPHMQWDSSEEQMGAPREMRVHVQRVIAIPAPHQQQEPVGAFQPPPLPPQGDQNEQPTVIHQFVPQPAPTQELDQSEMENLPMSMGLEWGLSPEDMRMIHRTAEGVMTDAQRETRDKLIDSEMQEVKTIVNSLAAAAAAEAEAHAQAEARSMNEDDNRSNEQPAPTMLLPQEMHEKERPHYVQPRSVRSVDNLLHREKRVKRCACNCA